MIRDRSRSTADQVAEHRSGLDGGELVGVADQDQLGVGAHCFQQPGHQRQRDHRGLVDDDEVVGEVVVPVVPETAVRVGSPAEQAVQGRCRGSGWHVDAVAGKPGELLGYRFLHPCGCLAGRRGECDTRRLVE